MLFMFKKDVVILKPVIGVMPLWDETKKSIWMLPEYLGGIIQAGGVPMIFPLSDHEEELKILSDMCDGFLFTGGQDVSPEIYNEKPLGKSVSCCRIRDRMETIILKEAMKNDKPLLGICRGIQLINAELGGTLYQDIPTQYPSSTEHHQRAPYDVPVHTVNIVKDSPLYSVLKTECLPVNSYHHQAVKAVAPDLEVMAISEDGLTEALYRPKSRFLWAVQWHPEFSYKKDVNSSRIFKAFVDAAL